MHVLGRARLAADILDSVAERVVSLDVGITWEPNAPGAVLLTQDDGVAQLVINAHPDDPDQRLVILRWGGCIAAVMEPPNDEALGGHRLYHKGLSGILWAGEVFESEWIAKLERQNRVHPNHDPAGFAGLRHVILPLKERTVELLAYSWSFDRSDRIQPRLSLNELS